MKNMIRLLAALAALTFAATAARADDIDIFSGIGGSGGAPQVLLVVDNGSSNDANFSYNCAANSALNGTTILGMVNCALYSAVGAITTQPAVLGKLAMGVMVYGKNEDKGGLFYYPNSQPYDLVLLDNAGISAFQSLITGTPIKSEGNAKADGEFYDVWAWFTGHTNRNGDITYSSHLGVDGLACRKSFVIYIGGSVKQGRPCTGSGCSSASELANAGATTAQQVQINSSTLGPFRDFETKQISWMDEWARFLHQTNFSNDPNNPQGITTYTIAIGTDEPNYNQTLESTAIHGGGKAFVATDIESMIRSLLQIFNEIAAVNTAFASSSLPVAANAQGTFLNQIFMGQFRPDGAAGPRWAGNLKQYQFAVKGSPPNEQLFLADANGDAAISGAGTGFISATAESFWTSKDTSTLPDSVGGFWLNNPTGAGNGFDMPDGEIVDKGGAAQQIRLDNLQNDYTTNPHSPRNVYTCTTGCAKDSSLNGFHFATDNSSITDTALGITAATNSVSSLSRSGGTVTVVLSAAPSPLLVDGQTVAMAGAAYPELNGTFTITKVNETTFTYTINESPMQAATSTGTYTASLPSNPKAITQLTRVGTGTGTAQSRVTATVVGHGYANNQNVTISGASGAQYNGTFPITVVDANTFTYLITDGPTTPGGGGTATQGVNVLTIPAGGITRGSTALDWTSVVTVTFASDINPNSAFKAGSTVTIAGATPTSYNGTYTITAGNANNACGTNGSAGRRVFCFSMTTLPATPDTTTGMTADVTASSTVTLTHPVTCTGATPSATTTVTATTSAPHSFAAGNSISVAGNPIGANESRYVGTFTIASVPTSTTFTYPITVSPSLCTFSTAGVTAATTTGGADRNSLINWVRGQDNVGDEQSPGNGINIRPSVHGDVLHSRPTVINYGTGTGVVVFYGSNDGTFRAVNGNQPLGNGNPIGGADPGGEIFSFIPTEFYKKLKRLYQNSPQIKLANTPTGLVPTPMPRDYFFDGSTGVYQGGGKVYLYLAGRRGTDENGKGVIYALDVSAPDNPKFLWKHIGGETGFEELGQAWSTPKVAFVKGHVDGSGNPLPVVIFGGGYDTNQDSDPPGSATDSVGRAIYVLDAADGTIVWKAVFAASGGATSCTGNPCNLSGMTYSIPSDITLLNRDYDLNPGYIDRLYAADVGGNIWRVDLEPSAGTSPANWKVTLFASVGGSGSPKRKFFFPPDVVTTKDFDMVMAGTGDREHPLYSASTTSSYAVKNRFYGLRDPNVGTEVAPGWVAISDATASTGTAVPGDLTHVIPPSTLYDAATATDKGFYIDMPNAGEKIVNAPTTVGGFSYFGTNTPPLPDSQACTNLGTARGYQVNFLTGATRSNVIDGGGLPPSPVAGLVTIDMGGGNEKTFPFLLGPNPDPTCQGPDCTSSFGGSRPPVPIPPTRRRVYWYVDKHDN